jgi:prevent-host-death family protein
MTRQINLYEAKTQLSKLVDEAANGGTIIIAKDGKPMARLVPLGDTTERQPRKLGQMAEYAKGIDWNQWWRDWKAADRAIETEFEASAVRPLATGREKPRRKRRR